MLMSVTPTLKPAEILYSELMNARRGDDIEHSLARILSSWMLQKGAMPDYLGLAESDFNDLMCFHFPAFNLAAIKQRGITLDAQRFPEIEDLRKLLINNRSTGSPSESWMAAIIIAGCLGKDHLWQDLGLWQRKELSKLMLDNFAPLASLNIKDMKWKKFLYKQLCETEGIYTCRAPSCDSCKDYQLCFGPEL